MAVEAELKPAVRRIAQSLRRYVVAQGWNRDDYRIYFETNAQWGRIGILIVARSFPGPDDFEQWYSIMKFLRKDIKDDPELVKAINLDIWTFDQLEEGGMYRVRPEYEEADDLFPDVLPA